MSNRSTESQQNQQKSPSRDGGRKYEAAGCAAGLSHCHISPSVTYHRGATLVQTYIPGPGRVGKRGVRRAISGFSAKSRRRLQQTCAEIQRDELPVFITLTYPGEFPTDSRIWKRHLDTIGKALVRQGYGFIWKLEPQKRGAPHFHLLAYGPVRGLHSFRMWLSEAWYRVVGSGDIRHFRAGTQVSRIRSMRGVRAYAAKYMSKTIDGAGWDAPGRFWGVVGAHLIPWGEAVTVELPSWMVHRLKRWLRRSTGWGYVSHTGQSFYVGSPEAWLDRLADQCALSA